MQNFQICLHKIKEYRFCAAAENMWQSLASNPVIADLERVGNTRLTHSFFSKKLSGRTIKFCSKNKKLNLIVFLVKKMLYIILRQ